ncbi:hypothetical protein Tco_0404727 [Tanacetum coccineum]
MSTLQFAETYNMIAFLGKPAESNGFHEIIDFLNANQIHYALTVNPTIYTSCIEQFWATTKAKTVNGERQLQALIDKKKVIIMESSIIHLEDAGGTDCLPTATIFEELARMGLGVMSHHKKIYVNPSHTKKIFANMKREGKDFSGRVTPLFATMMVQDNQEDGVDSGIPTDSQQTLITTQPSSSRPQKKQSRRRQRKETEVPQDETYHADSVPIPSNDPLLSGKDAQAKEITGIKKRDKESLGAQEDASKQGRIFEDNDKDAEVSLVDETQGKSDDAEMFDTDDLHGDEVIVDMAVGEKQEKSAKVNEREVSTSVEDSVAPTILVTIAGKRVTTAIDEITLAQTVIEIKAAKPKAITTAATTTTIRPKARGANKDQVALDEEMARNLEA